MRKKLYKHFIAALITIVLSVSAITSVSAVGFDLTPDTASVGLWSVSIISPPTAVLQTLASAFNVSLDFNGVFWFLMNSAVGKTGPQSLDYMNDLVARFDQAFNSYWYDSLWQHALKNSQALGRQTLGVSHPRDFLG